MKNKKAVSEIVAYVLLIVIVLFIAGLVYYFFVVNIPKPNGECPEDLFLVIKNYTCTGAPAWELNLAIKNKGYFNISGFYVRARRADEDVATGLLPQIGSPTTGPVYLEPELASGQEVTLNFDYDGFRSALAAVELQPYITEKGELLLCESSIITQKIVNC